MKKIKITGGTYNFPESKDEGPLQCSLEAQERIEECLMNADTTHEAIKNVFETDNFDAIMWCACFGILRIIKELEGKRSKIDVRKYKQRADELYEIIKRRDNETKN